MVVWERLIRFVATDGRILRGEPILPRPDFDLGQTTAATKLTAKVITGNDIYDTKGNTKVSDEVVTVKQLLGPLAQADVPILRCVGLNYAKHSTSTSGESHLKMALLTWKFSQGSRPIPTTLSVHLLQALDMYHRSQCRCSRPQDLPRWSSRL
jgi:hypothetical protein